MGKKPKLLIAVHADGGDCHGTPLVEGICPRCGLAVDSQSIELWPEGVKMVANKVASENLLKVTVKHTERDGEKVATATKIEKVGRPSIEPFHDLVLVEREAEAEKTKGGLFVPETAKDPVGRGKVLAVGPGKQVANLDSGQVIGIPCQAAAGDTVIFNKYAGSEVEIGGTTYLLLRDSEILGRVVG